MPSFFQLPKSTQYAAWALLGFMLFLIYDQYHWWQLRDEYAFGFIVPFFVGYVIFDRWPRISAVLIPAAEAEASTARTEPASSRRWSIFYTVIAVLMLTGGVFCFGLGAVYRGVEGSNLISSNMIAFGFANMILGGVFLYTDETADNKPVSLKGRLIVTSLFLFPAVIWMLSVPMFNAVQHAISTFLMNKVAIIVFQTFDVLGFAIIQEGSILKLPNGDVGVEDACSGIRSLTACLFAGSFLGAVYFEQLWKKVFMVGTAMLFAFINNIFRSLFLTGWAYGKGPDALNSHVEILGFDLGNVHDFTGWVVLGMTVVCLLLCVQLFSIRFEYDEPEPAAA
jgi:exosortase